METRGYCTVTLTPYCYIIFTATQIIILGYLAEKKSVQEIAGIRRTTEKTIYNEIQDMMHRIDCHSQPAFLMECFYQKLLFQNCNTAA